MTKIHVNGDRIVGRYATDTEAAVAYNKAAEMLQAAGIPIRYISNYIPELSTQEYRKLYDHIMFETRFLKFIASL